MSDWLRELGFRARSALRWSLPAWKRTRTLTQVLPRLSPEGRVRAEALAARHDLAAAWSACCSLTDWRESLYVLDLLDRHLPGGLPEGRGLDVGAKNGATLPGLATAQPRGWDAVELDAHRRYLSGATRRAHGERMARSFAGCRFIAGDVRGLEGPWAVVTWLLPFLSEWPVAAWGLPRRVLAPAELLRHVLERLVPGGCLFIVNQAEEVELQRSLLEELGISARALGVLDSPLSPYQRERVGWLIRRG